MPMYTTYEHVIAFFCWLEITYYTTIYIVLYYYYIIILYILLLETKKEDEKHCTYIICFKNYLQPAPKGNATRSIFNHLEFDIRYLNYENDNIFFYKITIKFFSCFKI